MALRRSLSAVFIKSLVFRSSMHCSRASQHASAGNVDVAINESTGVATLYMCKKPVNSLSLDMLTDMTTALNTLEANRQCNGLIITSAVPKIFCAGLDIQELYQAEPDRLKAFWRALQTFWMKLYISRLATIAAINGHSPAGGCLLALSCDYRIMSAGSYRIGLNETLLGIVAPFWFVDSMQSVIGQRRTEKAVQLGTLFSSQEALQVGLVDEVVTESEILKAAEHHLASWINVPQYARQLTKQALRKPVVDRLAARQDNDVENIVKFLTQDSVQQSLGRYLQSLKKPKL